MCRTWYMSWIHGGNSSSHTITQQKTWQECLCTVAFISPVLPVCLTASSTHLGGKVGNKSGVWTIECHTVTAIANRVHSWWQYITEDRRIDGGQILYLGDLDLILYFLYLGNIGPVLYRSDMNLIPLKKFAVLKDLSLEVTYGFLMFPVLSGRT
jgi:hypothetical protein